MLSYSLTLSLVPPSIQAGWYLFSSLTDFKIFTPPVLLFHSILAPSLTPFHLFPKPPLTHALLLLLAHYSLPSTITSFFFLFPLEFPLILSHQSSSLPHEPCSSLLFSFSYTNPPTFPPVFACTQMYTFFSLPRDQMFYFFIPTSATFFFFWSIHHRPSSCHTPPPYSHRLPP